jgi:hypothetical protein
MEAGRADAWDAADRKIKDPRVHAVNKAALIAAKARLTDPRESATK